MSNRDRIWEKLVDTLGAFKATGTERDFACPFCLTRGADHQGTLHINPKKNAAICHSCSYASRNLLNLIRDAGGDISGDLSKIRFVVPITDDFAKLVGRILEETPETKEVSLPAGFTRLTLPASGLISKVMYNYLHRRRGLADAQIDDLGIGYGTEGLVDGHVIFPVYVFGHLVFWTSRCVFGSGPKALHPAGVAKSNVLFNYESAHAQPVIYVAEGPMDAVAFGKGGVAVFGHTLSKAQMKLLNQSQAAEICICFDADKQRETTATAESLSHFTDKKVSYVLLEEGDPDENREHLNDYKSQRQEIGFLRSIRRWTK